MKAGIAVSHVVHASKFRAPIPLHSIGYDETLTQPFATARVRS
jgi:hypothetical protein